MAWEKRNGRGCYFTTSVQRNGHRKRLYFGSGPAANLAATLLLKRQVERKLEAEKRRKEQAQIQAAEALLDDLCVASDLLVRGALTTAGYHQHDRGAWRRKRHVQPKLLASSQCSDKGCSPAGSDPSATE
jgi:hypothetical protein